MSTEWKLAEELTSADVSRHPVWEYVTDDSRAPETAVQPVSALPVDTLGGRLVGVSVKLHNGIQYWAICSNISLRNPAVTRHFMCVSLERNGQWFELARYHDPDFDKRSPERLAEFLELPVREVFPIEYDISNLATGEEAILRGTIPQLPEAKLDEDELIQLALMLDD